MTYVEFSDAFKLILASEAMCPDRLPIETMSHTQQVGSRVAEQMADMFGESYSIDNGHRHSTRQVALACVEAYLG